MTLLRILSGTVVSVFILACAPTRAEGAAGGCEAELVTTKPFFYRVEKDGQTSFLLGTVHVGVPLRAFPSAVHEVIASCADLTFETSNPTGLRKLWNTAGDCAMFSNIFGRRLSKQLGERDWQTYRARLVANDIPPVLADYLSPLAANFLASPNFKAMVASLGAGQLEAEIGAIAAAAGKSVRGLESHRAQRRLMIRIFSLQNLVENLNKPVDQLVAPGATPRDEYLSGNPAPTIARNEGHRVGAAEFYEYGILARNRAWIPLIERRHARPGVTLFAVGNAHLFGDASADEGVLNLLRARGFVVTRVTGR